MAKPQAWTHRTDMSFFVPDASQKQDTWKMSHISVYSAQLA